MEVGTPTAKGGGGGDAPIKQQKDLELLDVILQNGVISEKIGSFLSFGDMKMISEASTGFCSMIRKTRRFQNSAILRICKETVQLETMLVDSEFEWKAIEIDCTIPNVVFSIISDILRSVTFIKLQLVRTDKVEKDDLVQLLTDLLTNAPNLDNLQLESVFFEKDLHDVLSAVTVQEALERLTCLEITTGLKKNDATHYINCDEGEDEPFPRSFLQLSMIPLKLESLHLGKICTINGTETDHIKFVPNLILANASHLVSLRVHMCEVWKMETMTTIFCPNLKSLELTAYADDVSTVNTFLTNQPHLEELTIRIKEEFPVQILKVIHGRGNKLKKLHITAKAFVGNISKPVDLDPLVDWSFLAKLENLKDFSITRPYIEDDIGDFVRSGTGISFLRSLPSSVAKLQLRGLTKFWYDCAQNEYLTDAEQRRPLLCRFTNLTSLSFIRCSSAFDIMEDNLLQSILQNCVRLRKLEITHASGLSNYSIDGIINEENVGVSLQRSTGLEHLVIKSCNSITIEGVLNAVALPFLRHFEYLSLLAVSKDGLLKLVKQNPSLESISVFISEMDDISELEKDVKAVNRRITRVVNLDDKDWPDQDSESDADEIRRHWGDGDSDFSGGGGYQDFLDVGDVYDEYDDDDDYDDDAYDFDDN